MPPPIRDADESVNSADRQRERAEPAGGLWRESIGMERMKKKASMVVVGYTIGAAQDAETEVLGMLLCAS